MKNKYTYLLLAWFYCAVTGYAVTSTAGNGTLTFTQTPTGINWSYTATNTGGSSGEAGQAWLYVTTGQGGGFGQQIFDVSATITTLTGSGSFACSPGTWFRYSTRTINQTTQQVTAYSGAQYYQLPAATYKTTVTIPANDTLQLIRYELWQDGAYTGHSWTTGPGDSALITTVTGLPANTVTELREVHVNMTVDENGVFVFAESDYVRTVSTGTPVISTDPTPPAGTTVGPKQVATTGTNTAPAPATVVTAPPTTPATVVNITATAPVTLPPATTPTPAPTPVTNPTPTGANPVIKQDLMETGNVIKDAVDATASAVVTASNKQVLATDTTTKAVVDTGAKNLEAIDKAANATVTAVNSANAAAKANADVAHRDQGEILKALGAANTIQQNSDKVRDAKLTTIADNTAATTTAVGDLKDIAQAEKDEKAADKTAWTESKDSNWSSTAATKKTEGSAAVTAALSGNGVSNWSATSQPAMTVVVGGITADVAPWNNSMIHTGAAIIKGLFALLIAYHYFVWVYETISRALNTLILVPQTRGNTVGGTGGQITALVAAGIITGLILAAPAAYAAYIDTGGTLGWGTAMDLKLPFSQNGVIGQTASALLEEFLPMATIIATMAGRLSVLLGLLSVGTGIGVAIKWIVPAFALLLSVMPNDITAAVTVRNTTAAAVTVTDGQGNATNCPVGVTTVPASTVSVYHISVPAVALQQTPANWTVEVMDDGFVSLNLAGQTPQEPVVAHPATVWLYYLNLGFVAGMVMELVGFSYRLLYQVSASTEGAV